MNYVPAKKPGFRTLSNTLWSRPSSLVVAKGTLVKLTRGEHEYSLVKTRTAVVRIRWWNDKLPENVFSGDKVIFIGALTTYDGGDRFFITRTRLLKHFPTIDNLEFVE